MLPVLGALLLGCQRPRALDGELVALLDIAPTTIDPRACVTASDYRVSRMVYAPLVSTESESLEPKMELARRVYPNGNDWEIELGDARFSDGKPVTSDDVLYTFERFRDPATLGGAAARMRRSLKEAGLVDIEVHDEKRLTVHMSHPHATFITDLNFGLLERPPAGSAPDAPPLGAGAFRFVARRGDTWSFAANEHYYGGRPRIDRLTFKTIADQNSRLLALVGGSADFTQNTIVPLLIDAVAEQPRLKVETAPSTLYTYLGLNGEDPILKDVRVRRAIALAIDRATIVHTTLHDRARLASGMLPEFHWAYNAEVARYPFDPEQAKRLLDAAGHPDPDGDGPAPRFQLVYKSSSDKLRVALARIIADMLARVGIAVDLRVYEFATFFADVKKGNFQLFLMQIPDITEPDLYTNFFASERIPTRENLDAGGNRVRYRSAELDALLEEGRRTMARPERVRIYRQVQAVLARDVPVVSLWHEDAVAVMRRSVSGYRMLPTMTYRPLDGVERRGAR